MPRGPGGSPEFKIPLKGIEQYKWFYEARLSEVLENYHEGKITKSVASEAIASACAGKSGYQIFHIVDVWENGEPVDRRLFRSDRTLGKLLKLKGKGQAILYRGMFVIPEEVWRDYKRSYRGADRFRIFKLDRLIRLAPYILMDLDAKDGVKEEDVKRLVSYLHKLEIFPEVWRSPSGGFHVYIHLVGQVQKLYRTTEDGEKEEVIKHYLPYASDFRLPLVIKALKDICHRLNISYDSISSDRAVWMEGIENPLKEGKKSERIFEGAVHRLDKLFEKLRPVWEREIREEAWRRFEREILKGGKKREAKGSVEIREADHSNPIDYLQENVSFAFRMLDKGYTWAEIETELKAVWKGDKGAFDRAFRGFRDFVERVYRPLPKKEEKKVEGRKRKHKHYWEYVPIISRILRENPNLSLREIARRTGIPTSSLSDIFKLVSREQVLNSPEEAQEFLRSRAKGGDHISEEQRSQLREQGRERWLRYFEETLKKSLSPKPRKGVEIKDEGLPPAKEVSVRIGHRSITQYPLETERKGEDGDISPSKMEKREKGIRIVDEVERLLYLVNLSDSENLRKLLLRLLFGALRRFMRGEREIYNLSRFSGFSGLGESFMEALSGVLRRMGHEVKNEEEVTGVEPEEVVDVEEDEKDIVPLPDPEDETEDEKAEDEVIFAGVVEAIFYLESQNGKYRVGDRVKLWVIAPTGEPKLYEFEKVLKRKYMGLADIEGYEVETWELKTIHWYS